MAGRGDRSRLTTVPGLPQTGSPNLQDARLHLWPPTSDQALIARWSRNRHKSQAAHCFQLWCPGQPGGENSVCETKGNRVPKLLRSDFASASIGLTLPGQHKNLAELHDWLTDELGINASERVVALTNYQQGRFGRLPTHILLVTTDRIAYTHDAGMRSVPLPEVDTSRVGLRAGLVNGDLTVVLRSGEELGFRRGMSMGMQEVAAALEAYDSAGASEPPPPPRAPGAHQPSYPTPGGPPAQSAPEPDEEEDAGAIWWGAGDDVIQFDTPADGLVLFRIHGGGPNGLFAVWTLSPDLTQNELLVNSTSSYSGVRVAGLQGSVAGVQIRASDHWTIEAVGPEELPVLEETCGGVGDVVILMREDLTTLEAPLVLAFSTDTSGLTSMGALGMTPTLLINTIGSYSGTVIVPAGTQFLTLRCDGAWDLSRQ